MVMENFEFRRKQGRYMFENKYKYDRICRIDEAHIYFPQVENIMNYLIEKGYRVSFIGDGFVSMSKRVKLDNITRIFTILVPYSALPVIDQEGNGKFVDRVVPHFFISLT